MVRPSVRNKHAYAVIDTLYKLVSQFSGPLGVRLGCGSYSWQCYCYLYWWLCRQYADGNIARLTCKAEKLSPRASLLPKALPWKESPLGWLLCPLGMGLPKLPCCPRTGVRPPPEISRGPGLLAWSLVSGNRAQLPWGVGWGNRAHRTGGQSSCTLSIYGFKFSGAPRGSQLDLGDQSPTIVVKVDNQQRRLSRPSA